MSLSILYRAAYSHHVLRAHKGGFEPLSYRAFRVMCAKVEK